MNISLTYISFYNEMIAAVIFIHENDTLR